MQDDVGFMSQDRCKEVCSKMALQPFFAIAGLNLHML